MDAYTGEVSPGGEAQVRELSALTITKLAVDRQMSNNCYLLTCRATGEKLLVDAADEAGRILALCDGELATVVTTHQHWDHHRALPEVIKATGAATCAGAPDADAITEQTGVAVDRRLAHGDVVEVGEARLEVIALAGHTPGSVALLYDDSASPHGNPHLFTGDSLFPGGVGNTFGDRDAFAQLIDEVSAKVFDRLADETWFYPGHGNDSTVGAERPHVDEWRTRGW